MRWGLIFSLVVMLWSAAFAADEQQNLLTLPCAQPTPGYMGCAASKADLSKAKAAFSRGLRLEKEKHFDEAYQEFDTAARLVPTNVNYVTALSLVREQLVFDHVQRGNAYLTRANAVEAQAEFRSALNLDPQNDFAKQRLRESMGEWAPAPTDAPPLLVEDSGELHVVPDAALADFHFRGDSKELLTAVAKAFGVAAEFDESVVSRRVQFDIERVDFYQAMRAAGAVTGTFWTPLGAKQVLLARDNQENHRLFDRMALRTFYLPQISSQQDAAQIVTLLRTIFDVRFFGQQPQAGRIEVRAPVLVLDAITKTLEGLVRSRPQVMLDVHIYQIDHTFMRTMGMQLPNQFTLYNIPASAIAALAALGGQNIQSLINQLISGGGINQANSQSLQSLIAQLQGQSNSIFSQGLATFGGGLTLMGLSLGTLGAQMSLNESWVKTLDHASLLAAQNLDTTFRIGSRYPILNASFAPVYNSAAISQVVQNGSFQAPFPSFSYEDLGLSIKAKPVINLNSDVSLQLEIELRSLAGQSLNSVPVIANRQYKGSITLMDGEPAIVASSITQSETRSLNGIPGLGDIPVVNHIAVTNARNDENDELVIVITPHITSQPDDAHSVEVWLPKGS